MQISEFFSPISESIEQEMSNAPIDCMWQHVEKNLGSSGFPFMNNIKMNIMNGKIDAAKMLCAQTNSPVARLTEKGISRIGKPLEVK